MQKSSKRRSAEEEIRHLMREAGPGLSYREAREMVLGSKHRRVDTMEDWRGRNPVGEEEYPAGYMQGRGAA
jgi:hypothetical protein